MEKLPIYKDIQGIISKIDPCDDLERTHIEETLSWIESGVQIFRTEKPDIPNKHLVSYFVIFDEETRKILLVDHKNAQIWLPAGGHVDLGEHPQETARRECLEELFFDPEFWCEDPVFITSTPTVGLTAGHVDVSLWYVLKGTSVENYQFDHREFNSIRWFSFEDVPFEKADPHLKRFLTKLKALL